MCPAVTIVLLAGICRRRLSSSVALQAGGPAGRRARGRPTLHDRPVRLRPVRATP